LIHRILPTRRSWPFSDQIYFRMVSDGSLDSSPPDAHSPEEVVFSILVHSSGHFYLFKDNKNFPNYTNIFINGSEIFSFARIEPPARVEVHLAGQITTFTIESDGLLRRRAQTSRCAFCAAPWNSDNEIVVVCEEEEYHESCAHLIEENRARENNRSER
ncbi:hypothetical protein JXO59_05365, partial [candidate division KSB1 bacterium]|nr:hypothetical protein [candidate division KSB1 bacterium]